MDYDYYSGSGAAKPPAFQFGSASQTSTVGQPSSTATTNAGSGTFDNLTKISNGMIKTVFSVDF